MIEPPLIRKYANQNSSTHARPIGNPSSLPSFCQKAAATRTRTRRSISLAATLYALVGIFCIFALASFSANNVAHARAVPAGADSALHLPSIDPTNLASFDSSRTHSTDDKLQTVHADPLARRASDSSLTATSHDGFSPIYHSLSLRAQPEPAGANNCSCDKGEHLPISEKVAFGVLMPILVLLSGLFAGLTLGYMSLDETQLQVLAAQGTPQQRADAAKISTVTKDRHLLLTTLLIANMITNETLPVIADPLLGGGVQAVIVSTVLVIVFAELIPQSVCARYGLVIGAYMVWPTRIIIFCLYPIAWPVSRILHYLLGAHSGIVYRRAELKELVTMHAAAYGKGGDLKGDTIMIVGGALDLQEKVVKDAMTPIDKVFMLPYSAKLDYATLERVVRSGHSRIPIYQEYDVPVVSHSGTATPSKKPSLLTTFARKASMGATNSPKLGPTATDDKSTNPGPGTEFVKRKKILGSLLVKSCVLLDPEDATPLSEMVINAIPTVPGDEPLLNVLNVFQEGRSHMAIVSSRSRRTLADGVADVGSKSNMFKTAQGAASGSRMDGLGDIDEEKQLEVVNSKDEGTTVASEEKSKEALEFEESFGGPDSPIGIITLEDVLEELIGEEIWDEYDEVNGRPADFARLSPPPSPDSRGRDPEMHLALPDPRMHEKTDFHKDGAAEKAVTEDQPTVVHSEQAQQQEAALSAPGGGPAKTVLQRLGLARARSVREDTSTERSSSIPSVAAVDSSSPNLGTKASLPVGSVQHPRTKGSVPDTAPSATTSAASGALTGLGVTTTHPSSASAASSTAPSAGGVGNNNISSVRPVVVRSTTASGQTSTATALLPETLLRGRRPGAGANETEPLPPGSIVHLGGAGPLSPAIGGGAAAAAAALGARAHRFKSTPVPRPAMRARSVGPGGLGGASPSSGGGGGGGEGGLEQSVSSLNGPGEQQQQQGALFIASPAAMELEMPPLDASIASLPSGVGSGRSNADGQTKDE
ncbi:unnamed protein product [Tilletia controversa]|uniref:CNNM transmembrane domain-containing protein n=1 Tax=Tilletia controversa TaxID=13291 RepID=A0A8X7SZD4_9BASI|nr:hypothetical protein CF328_g1563 [Tilletia controversa]KAE8252855.1 hypothetical protein A4X06_0g1875 [Tilletia controversa]CAD6909150.1 unnamed protein product [Tilletia controversa]CAD6916748.1 unnamed protein product [Tilletia controversa]CAD6968303.1 unnamed protein product [Tilletia controversa]